MENLKVKYQNNITWFNNLQYIVFSVVLIIIVTLIDLRIFNLHQYLPRVMTTSVNLAKSILTTLAGSLLTITTFTFSTILVVINMYTNTYTPRVVENFINKKIAMKVLGVFIGGFVYCITSLLFMRDYFENQQVIAGFIGIVYSIICIVYFIIFVQSIIKNFQGVNLISEISNSAVSIIAKEVEKRTTTAEYTPKNKHNSFEIICDKSGYLNVIDYNLILEVLSEGELFNIEAKIGDYISENKVIGTVSSLKAELTNHEIDKIRRAFILQDKKIAEANYLINLTKIYEIAARALSSGVNDPNTAIHCINKLGMLMRPLAEINQYHIQHTESKGSKIFYTSYRFEEDLNRYYIPLVNYAKSDLMVILAVIDSLKLMISNATYTNKESIFKILVYIKQKVSPNLDTDLEIKLFNQALTSIDEIEDFVHFN